MTFVFRAPHTLDGQIVDVSPDGDDRLLFEAEFVLGDEFREHAEGREEEIEFASRSRIARLGIDIVPTGPLRVDGETARMTASARAVVRNYDVERFLADVLLPGVAVGRLVFCNREKKLSSDDVYEAYVRHEFQLPAGFSIGSTGGFTIRPHQLVYDLQRPLTRDDLLTILARDAGKALLNRLQVPRVVENVILDPGEGVITSCSMFLHRHYVVLESDASSLGRHMQATVLDPISTRGPRVFLEFFNDTSEKIVNPSATGTVYAAERIVATPRSWLGNGTAGGDELPPSKRGFLDVGRLFDTIVEPEEGPAYFHRHAAVAVNAADLEAEDPQLDWHLPVTRSPLPTDDVAASSRISAPSSRVERFGTRVLDDVPTDAGVTLLLRYFPNLGEHGDILHAGLQGKVGRIVFERASFEHGSFLSARDHGRLADYHDLGIELFWQNHDREHLVKHVFRGRRGYWCDLDGVESFRIALIASVYGSSRPLGESDAGRLQSLLIALRDFFGEDLSVLTGGGPGSMLQASTHARDLGLLVGANYLEIEDQKTNKLADFYQVFQENCRHSRQRWFEIASFPIFCIGGVGTLEEIGMTLTDIKLGVVEGVPLVFFGGSDAGDLYWRNLVEQLRVFADEKRGPEWLRSRVLLTSDPHEVVAFYRRTLSLG